MQPLKSADPLFKSGSGDSYPSGSTISPEQFGGIRSSKETGSGPAVPETDLNETPLWIERYKEILNKAAAFGRSCEELYRGEVHQ